MLPISAFVKQLWSSVLEGDYETFSMSGYTFSVVYPAFIEIQDETEDTPLCVVSSYEELVSFFRVFL